MPNFRTPLLVLLLGCFSVQAQQTGPFNQYNPKHKKQGLWKVFLTDHLITTKDSTQATYCAYDYYDNGTLVVWTSGAQNVKKKAVRMEHEGDAPQKGKPVLLNGKFKFYDKFGLILDETYKNGLPVFTATCTPTAEGTVVQTETIDYTQTYKGQFCSFRYQRRNMSNEIIYDRWFAKKENGKWDFIEIE